TIALAGALRIVGVGWNMVMSPVHARGGAEMIRDFDLPDHPDLLRLGERLAREEARRRPYDRHWVLALVAILFAIHVGRMQADWPVMGLTAPIGAVGGDVVSAVLLALGVLGPARLALRRATWSLERRGWARLVARAAERPPRLLDRLLRVYLVRSL